MATKLTIAGNTFLFTGKLTEFTREEAEAHVEAEGGKVLSGVSAKLNYLVVGEDAGSKLAKAEALGTVTILHEKEFLKMMNYGKKSLVKSAPNKASTKDSSKTIANKISSDKAYEEVQIGKQIWMAKNLDVAHFRNGDPIPQAKNAKDWEKAGIASQPICCSYENKKDNEKIYGKLYNWYAVNDPRGLAPSNYIVPTDEDWVQLIDFLGEEAGKKLKNTSGWDGKIKSSNDSGFDGLPGGEYNDFEAEFSYIKQCGYWWTATESNENYSWYRMLSYEDNIPYREVCIKGSGFSVRCIKSKYDKLVNTTKNINKKKLSIIPEKKYVLNRLGKTENQILNDDFNWSKIDLQEAKKYFSNTNYNALHLFIDGGPFTIGSSEYFNADFFEIFNSEVINFILSQSVEGSIMINFSADPTDYIIDGTGRLNRNLILTLSKSSNELVIGLEREYFYDYDDIEDEGLIKKIIKMEKNEKANKTWPDLSIETAENLDSKSVDILINKHFRKNDLWI